MSSSHVNEFTWSLILEIADELRLHDGAIIEAPWMKVDASGGKIQIDSASLINASYHAPKNLSQNSVGTYAGGGVKELYVDSLLLDGMGGNSGGPRAGGGARGSVLCDVNTLSGDGTISALGGSLGIWTTAATTTITMATQTYHHSNSKDHHGNSIDHLGNSIDHHGNSNYHHGYSNDPTSNSIDHHGSSNYHHSYSNDHPSNSNDHHGNSNYHHGYSNDPLATAMTTAATATTTMVTAMITLATAMTIVATATITSANTTVARTRDAQIHTAREVEVLVAVYCCSTMLPTLARAIDLYYPVHHAVVYESGLLEMTFKVKWVYSDNTICGTIGGNIEITLIKSTVDLKRTGKAQGSTIDGKYIMARNNVMADNRWQVHHGKKQCDGRQNFE